MNHKTHKNNYLKRKKVFAYKQGRSASSKWDREFILPHWQWGLDVFAKFVLESNATSLTCVINSFSYDYK